MRALLAIGLVVSLSFAVSATSARAGDRGLYLHFLPVASAAEAPPDARAVAFADALEHTLFACGERPLPACRSTRVAGSDADGGLQWIYVSGADAVPAALRRAAFRGASGARALRTWVRRQQGEVASLDGLLLHQPAANGALALVVVNLNTGRSKRFVIRPGADGRPDLSTRDRDRMQAFLARGWVP
jgi:hypothetical protein